MIKDSIEQIRSMKPRQALLQAISFGLLCTSALMTWKAIMMFCFNESPLVVVLSGSMEPSMFRGDILMLIKYWPINNGDVVVYSIEGQGIPIVHRIASLQEIQNKKTGKLEKYFLSVGDNNPVDDRGIYPKGQAYLHESAIVGHVFATIPYSGFFTLLLNDYPPLKYAFIALLALSTMVNRDS